MNPTPRAPQPEAVPGELRRERAEAERALADREAWLRALLDHMADAVLTVDDAGRVVSVNPAAERMFGYEARRVVGVPVRCLLEPPPGESVGPQPSDAVGTRQDGAEFAAEVAWGPLVRDGRRSLVCTIRDVSARKELERQFLLAQRLETVATLARGIAHDFNNVLTGVMGRAALAADLLAPGHPARGQLDRIETSCRRSGHLVWQLLAFARAQPHEPRRIELGALVAGLDPLLRRLLGETIALRIDVEPDLPPCLADASQIEQVVMNLAGNARDAMPGGGRLHIEVRARDLDLEFAQAHGWARVGRYVELRMLDSGVGMDAATLGRALDPFFTTKRAANGSGLGLSVVSGIVERHGGLLDVQSQPGQGTAVRMLLAVVGAESDEQPGVEPDPASESATVLVAEDDPEVREVLVGTLRRNGYDVLEACDGPRALELFQAYGTKIALVVADSVMPGMGAADLYGALRKHHPRLRFLCVTGYEAASAAGADLPFPVMTKPFLPDEFARRVRRVLNESLTRP